MIKRTEYEVYLIQAAARLHKEHLFNAEMARSRGDELEAQEAIDDARKLREQYEAQGVDLVEEGMDI